MCIACEFAFTDMLEAPPPEEGERILREQFAGASHGPTPSATPFTCEPSNPGAAPPENEPKP
jgi:hypothetical protein